MSDLRELRTRAEAAYGTRRRPASPSEVLALIDVAEAAKAYREVEKAVTKDAVPARRALDAALARLVDRAAG